ncbi:MAG: hypothetical protein PHE53_09550, partial [Thermoguttaceae bacterium]|nr:hypothetical protein [Thermoguttaceae bacterium]
MPRILAIDWDQYEVRALVAQVNGAKIRIEQLVTGPMFDQSARPISSADVDDSQASSKQTANTPSSAAISSNGTDSTIAARAQTGTDSKTSPERDGSPEMGESRQSDRTSSTDSLVTENTLEKRDSTERGSEAGDAAAGRNRPVSKPDPAVALRNVLAKIHSVPSTVVVGIGRYAVEAFPVSLPPTKDAEVPGLIQVQAMSESALYTEEAALDYAILSGKPNEPREALGVVLPVNQLQDFRTICTEAGIKPSRMALRLFGTVALYRRQMTDELSKTAHTATLVVSRNGDEADLLVMHQDQILLTRSVRLPSEVQMEVVSERLAGEIHRTFVVAATGILSERNLQMGQVLLLGTSEECRTILSKLKHLEDTLQIRCHSPFDGFILPSDGKLPERPGRFASLLGFAVEEGRKTYAIDFLHPKRPPQPPNYRRIALLVVVLLLVVFGGFYWNRMESDAVLDTQIANRQAELSKLEKAGKKLQPTRNLVEDIGKWENSQIVGLDELRDLSSWFPGTR